MELCFYSFRILAARGGQLLIPGLSDPFAVKFSVYCHSSSLTRPSQTTVYSTKLQNFYHFTRKHRPLLIQKVYPKLRGNLNIEYSPGRWSFGTTSIFSTVLCEVSECRSVEGSDAGYIYTNLFLASTFRGMSYSSEYCFILFANEAINAVNVYKKRGNGATG